MGRWVNGSMGGQVGTATSMAMRFVVHYVPHSYIRQLNEAIRRIESQPKTHATPHKHKNRRVSAIRWWRDPHLEPPLMTPPTVGIHAISTARDVPLIISLPSLNGITPITPRHPHPKPSANTLSRLNQSQTLFSRQRHRREKG